MHPEIGTGIVAICACRKYAAKARPKQACESQLCTIVSLLSLPWHLLFTNPKYHRNDPLVTIVLSWYKSTHNLSLLCHPSCNVRSIIANPTQIARTWTFGSMTHLPHSQSCPGVRRGMWPATSESSTGGAEAIFQPQSAEYRCASWRSTSRPSIPDDQNREADNADEVSVNGPIHPDPSHTREMSEIEKKFRTTANSNMRSLQGGKGEHVLSHRPPTRRSV